jgi:anaerobic selenocysteine-containing dehydrogenase
MIVSFGGMMDDTTSMADLILPEHHYLEDWGTDIPLAGVGYELVGFQQPVVRPFFEDRGDNLGTKGFGDVLLALAQVMQMDLGLNADTFKEVIRESARELYALGRGSINAPTFEAFWNGVLQRGGWWDVNAKGPSSA